MDRYTCFDTDSLLSYPYRVALDDYPLTNPPAEPVSSFPHPPSGAKSLENATTHSLRASIKTFCRNYMIHELPLLQEESSYDGSKQFHPVQEAGCSYGLIAPFDDSCEAPLHSLERLTEIMFSPKHMLSILNNPSYLVRFHEFLLKERPRSLLPEHAQGAKSNRDANVLARCSIDVSPNTIVASEQVGESFNLALQYRVQEAPQEPTAEKLPAFITSRCIGITSRVVEKRTRGTLPRRFQKTSDGLAEVFCLTDPSRRGNPIIFASEEFHRTTQNGMDYVLGRNCRFPQGPKTNPNSVRIIKETLQAERHHSKLFLNYHKSHRDGSPFMNILQCVPLCDSQGTVRYFIGAQIDVSGLAIEGAQMESFYALLNEQHRMEAGYPPEKNDVMKEVVYSDEFAS